MNYLNTIIPYIFVSISFIGIIFVSKFLPIIRKFPSGIRLSWFLIAFSSVCAIYFTNFHTLLIPFVFLNIISLFFFKFENQQHSNFGIFNSLIALLFFTVLIQMLVNFNTPTGGESIIHRDFINNFIIKNFSIRTTGIEDNNVSLYHEKGSMHPNFYHYFDVWCWNFFAYFRKYFSLNVVFFQIAIPFLLTWLSNLVFDLLQIISWENFNRRRASILAIIFPFIVPISYLAMGQEYYLGFIFSAFNQAKFIFIYICLAYILYFYFSQNRYSFYLASLAMGIGFINLIPAIGVFILLVFIIDIYQKKVDFKDKNLYLVAFSVLLAVVYIVYLYYPLLSSGKSYMSDKVQTVISTKEKLVRRLAIIRDVFIILALYLPYFVLAFFGIKKTDFIEVLKTNRILLVLIFGGSLGWLVLHYTFFDSNQFFYNIYPFVMSLFVVLLLGKINSKTYFYFSIIIIILGTTFINCNYSKITFNYKEHQGITKKELVELKYFTKDKSPQRNAYLTFDGRDTKHFTEYLIGDYYWYLVNNSPFATVFLDDKNQTKIEKDYKQVNQIMMASFNTPYGQFSKRHKLWTTAQKQIIFIKKHKISYLSVENGYPLAKSVKNLAKDSLQLPQAKMMIYKF